MYSTLIAGTTSHTVQCAQALLDDDRFEIIGVLTPTPKVIGRKKILTKNPVQLFAEKNNLPIIFVDQKIDDHVHNQIDQLLKNQGSKDLVNYLLTVDFGYLVPKWLLKLPKIAPINIHPSDLPKYRGSSPGQYSILFGEKKSAVTVMIMSVELDEGSLIKQLYFEILNTFCTQDFYEVAFNIVTKELAQILDDYAQKKLISVPQPDISPTPITTRFTRDDGFVSWDTLQKNLAISPLSPRERTPSESVVSEGRPNSPLLIQAFDHHHSWPITIEHAVRALSPWPGVWTLVPTKDGEKRMKILEVSVENEKLLLKKVQVEGKKPSSIEHQML